ncbi:MULTISPECIES: hypothetical protein [Bifidobacterium]|jgi:hypothetical protein|uniref:hypothetical protein n=1 Tax=Bifidobacterium TaxID=1678 RepID=UPI00235214BF|nr:MULTISPECIES: hypothetical protein [Bifidobacterium]MCI1218217.1 hypothetical protein [Bifidobacterium crudilactis]
MKVVSSTRDWALTLKAEGLTINDVKEKFASYRWVGQLEEGGESGYQHYQLAIMNDIPVRFTTLQKAFPGIHIEPRAGSRRQLFDYCTKEDTRVDGPFYGGDWADMDTILSRGENGGKRSDLDAVRSLIIDNGASLDDVLLNPDYAGSVSRCLPWVRSLIEARDKKRFGSSRVEREVTYIYGPSGVGKTRGIEDAVGFENLCEVTDYRRDPWQGYGTQDSIFLDEYDGQLPFDFMLKLMDSSPVYLPARYSNRLGQYTHVYIASNLPPTDLYSGVTDARRVAFYRRLDEIVYKTAFDVETTVAAPKNMFQTDRMGFNEWLAGYDWKCGL